jgi:DNA adenine methylase
VNLNFITYVGGKFYSKEKIYRIFPNHDIFVEVFGGGANVLLHKAPSRLEVYNDLNKDLANLFYVLSFHYSEFYEKAKFLVYSREIFNKIKNEVLNTKIKFIPDIDRAVKVFYLYNTSFSGNMNSFGYSINKRNHPLTLYNKINKLQAIHKRLKNVIIESLDFEEIINKYDSENTLFFLDPPYLCTEFYYSTNDLSFKYEDHVRLLNLIKNIKGKFILTHYENELYTKELKDFNVITFDVAKHSYGITRFSKKEKKPIVKEFVFFNYELQLDLFKRF